MSDFSNRLKELRTSKGLTQRELGSFLNVTQNAIFNWETGRTEPSAETIERIANYFKVSPAYLMGWGEHKSLNNIIADNTARYRTQLNTSQEALAKYVGISTDAIRQIETGKVMPSPSELLKISEGLMITVNQLLDMPGETVAEANERYIHDTFLRSGYYIFKLTSGCGDEYWISNEEAFYRIEKTILDKLMESIDSYSTFSIEKALENSIQEYHKTPKDSESFKNGSSGS